MKAKIKATGEEIEVMQVYEKGDSFYVRLDMLSTTEVRYHISELEFEGIELPNKLEPDYWEKLKHQYAGTAMQSYISNNVYLREIRKMCKEPKEMRELVADLSILLATALVEKLKNE